MKDRLKNNIGLKIVSVLFATFLWWAVVNIDDPIDIKRINVNVKITNADVITNAGKSYQILDDTQSVTITIKARRKVLSQISHKDIEATADLREMQDTSVPIRIKIKGFEGEYEDINANPRNIQVKVENTVKKTFPIVAVAVGSPRAGHMLGALTVVPQTVDISGPESTIKKISKVVAKVDISEIRDQNGSSQDAAIKTTLLYYDETGKLIDKTLLTSSCDKNGVTVNVDMWKTKKIRLDFDTSAIIPAKGYAFAGLEVEPQFIEVSASTEKLENITALNITAEVLAMQDVFMNHELIVDITDYLPAGVLLADEDASHIAVRVLIVKSGTKTIEFPIGAIEIMNSGNFKVEYQPELVQVELTFTGTKEALSELTQDDISVLVDLQEYTEPGTYLVTLQVKDVPENCQYDSEVKIELTLSNK